MFRQPKHAPKKIKYITVHYQDRLLYNGKWEELPLDEKLITEYSIRFYNDPSPCFIRQSAVRIRLLAELEDCYEASLRENSDSAWLDALARYMGVPTITLAEFSEK